MTGLFFYLKAGAPGALRQATEHPFPEPALQKKPQDDLKRFELEQRMALSGYGWVDRSKGIARIPIEEAMRIIAARGDHAYDPLESPPEPANADQSERSSAMRGAGFLVCFSRYGPRPRWRD